MKKMNHSILFLLLFSIQAGDIALAQTVVLQDNLQGSTVGTQVGGGFTGEGYKPGTGENHILYDVPAQIQNGYVEVQVKVLILMIFLLSMRLISHTKLPF